FSRRIRGSVVVAVGSSLDRGRERRISVTRNLHGVLDEQPATLRARDRTLDEDEAALDVGADDFQVLLGAVLVAHVAGHLLVLEDPARILALTGRTKRTVADRHAVRCTHTAEAPALHTAGKALTLGTTLDIDQLAGNEVVSRDFGAHVQQAVFVDPEFSEDCLGLNFGLAELATLRLGNVLCLGAACAKLNGRVAILIFFATGDDLNAF